MMTRPEIDKLDEILATARAAKKAVNVRTLAMVFLLFVLVYFAYNNRQNTSAVREQSALLVNCTTPGTNPNAKAINDTGNACWDRLHDPRATDGAVAKIVDDIYCDQRRAQAKLPIVPDPTMSCREQTPSEVLAGSH